MPDHEMARMAGDSRQRGRGSVPAPPGQDNGTLEREQIGREEGSVGEVDLKNAKALSKVGSKVREIEGSLCLGGSDCAAVQPADR